MDENKRVLKLLTNNIEMTRKYDAERKRRKETEKRANKLRAELFMEQTKNLRLRMEMAALKQQDNVPLIKCEAAETPRSIALLVRSSPRIPIALSPILPKIDEISYQPLTMDGSAFEDTSFLCSTMVVVPMEICEYKPKKSKPKQSDDSATMNALHGEREQSNLDVVPMDICSPNTPEKLKIERNNDCPTMNATHGSHKHISLIAVPMDTHTKKSKKLKSKRINNSSTKIAMQSMSPNTIERRTRSSSRKRNGICLKEVSLLMKMRRKWNVRFNQIVWQ